MAAIASITNGEDMSSVRTKLNTVITEINILDPTDWVDYSATSTIVGWSSFTNKQIRYRIIGKQMFISYHIDGVSNSTSITFTLPNNSINIQEILHPLRYINNGVLGSSLSFGRMIINSNVVQCFPALTGGSWTASGSKLAYGQFFIEIA